MKTLKDILTESLILESDSSNTKQVEYRANKTIIHVPGMIWDRSLENNDWVYKMPYDLEIPKAKFYLFYDKYRKCPHIMVLSDIVYLTISIMMLDNIRDYDDYEVYSPKDVIMSSDSITIRRRKDTTF